MLFRYEDAYIDIKALNAMRREATSQLEALLLSHEVGEHVVPYVGANNKCIVEPEWICHVASLEQLEECLKNEKIDAIYWEWYYNDEKSRIALARTQEASKAFYLNLPAIMKDTSYQLYEAALRGWAQTEMAGYVIRNMGEYELVKDLGKAIVTDYNMNVMNNENIALWQEMGAMRTTISVELVGEELEGLSGNLEKIIYGHLPMMTSSQCLLRGTPQCQKDKTQPHHFEIEDRMKTSWRLQTDRKSVV